MRLDLFLKRTRLVRSRSRSNEICKKDMVTVNGNKAKPGKTVKQHDTIRIDFGRRTLVVEIVEIPDGSVRKSDASRYYTILSDEKVDPRLC